MGKPVLTITQLRILKAAAISGGGRFAVAMPADKHGLRVISTVPFDKVRVPVLNVHSWTPTRSVLIRCGFIVRAGRSPGGSRVWRLTAGGVKALAASDPNFKLDAPNPGAEKPNRISGRPWP